MLVQNRPIAKRLSKFDLSLNCCIETKEKGLKYIVYTTYSRPLFIYGKEDLPYPPKKKGLILLYQTLSS